MQAQLQLESLQGRIGQDDRRAEETLEWVTHTAQAAAGEQEQCCLCRNRTHPETCMRWSSAVWWRAANSQGKLGAHHLLLLHFCFPANTGAEAGLK